MDRKRMNFPCTLCEKTFLTSKGLSTHYAKAHPTAFSGHLVRASKKLKICDDEMETFEQLHNTIELSVVYNPNGEAIIASENVEDILDEDTTLSELLKLANYETEKRRKEDAEMQKIQERFRTGEVELAAIGIEHNLSQSTLQAILDFSRTFTAEELKNMRNPSLVYRNLEAHYSEHLSDSKPTIVSINCVGLRKSVLFAYESPIEMLKSLVRENRVLENEMLLTVDERFDKMGHSTFSELNTGSWWKTVIERVEKDPEFKRRNAIICPVILYSDSTVVDNLMKRSVHPIILQIGIHSYKQRNLLATKRVIGYLPDVSTYNVTDSKNLSAIRREVFNTCWGKVLEELKPGRVITEKIRGEGEPRYIVIFPAFFIADHPERLAIGCLRRSAQSFRPCPNCLITSDELTKDGPCVIGGKRVERNMDDLRIRADENTLKAYSLHRNIPFGSDQFRYLEAGLFDALPPCLMHTFSRITLYLLENIFEAVRSFGIHEKSESNKSRKKDTSKRKRKASSSGNGKQEAQESENGESLDEVYYVSDEEIVVESTRSINATQTLRITELENRFSRVPYFTADQKSTLVFRSNVTTLTHITAREKKSILFQLKYVLGSSNGSNFLPVELGKKVLRVLAAWCYLCKLFWTESGSNEISEEMLDSYEEGYKEFVDRYRRLFTLKSQDTSKKILFHAAFHFPDYVRMFGNPKNFTSDSLETAHGPLSKRLFHRTQKHSDATTQLLTVHRRMRSVMDIEAKREIYAQREMEQDANEPILKKEVISSQHNKARAINVTRKQTQDRFASIVPMDRFLNFLEQAFKNREVDLKSIDWKSLKFKVRGSIKVPKIGKLTATPKFGKNQTEKFPTVFILPKQDDQQDKHEQDLNFLRSNCDMKSLCEKFNEEDKIFLGKVYAFIEIFDVGAARSDLENQICIFFTHLEAVNKSELMHEYIEEPYVMQSIDENNKANGDKKYWWDLAFAEEIICPVNLIPDFDDKTGTRSFIDTYPILH